MNSGKEITSMGCGRSQQPGDCELRDIIVHGDANKLQKVPRMFREVEANKSCYVPLVVSIGPFHHGKAEFQLMEKQKTITVHQYTNNDPEKLQQLYTKVKNVAKDAKQCYSDEDGSMMGRFDDESFAHMMLLDGCFLLHFIYCWTKNMLSELKINIYVAACVQRDLLLLENQLPFQVLKVLLRSRFEENEWMEMLSCFIRNICEPPLKESQGKELTPANFENEPAHLLEVVRAQLIDKSAFENLKKGSNWSSYRSAKELKAIGIHFRPSQTCLFTDVKFEPTFSRSWLKLPPIKIDDSTKAMLLNIAAYEACLSSSDNFEVTSYICFIDSLIDHAEDVKELRSKGILLNFLGSDQQVADLFNQISDNLVPHPDAYTSVKGAIEERYKNKIKIWVAEWLHTHFTSPWTVLAFLGAIFALVLSVIQTYEAVYSSDN